MPTLVVCGERGRRQWLGGGARRRAAQCDLPRSAGHAHELGHQAGVRRGDRALSLPTGLNERVHRLTNGSDKSMRALATTENSRDEDV